MKDYIQKIIYAFTASKHNEEVTKEVHQWLLDEEYADEKEAALNLLWEETEGKVDANTWTSLVSVYNRIGVGQSAVEKKFRMRVWQYAAVAVVLLTVAVSGTFFFTKDMYSEVTMVEKFTPAGDMNTIELPDGSKVQTNSGTLLLYPESFKGDTRTVYLIGEANFKVKKNPDKPFIVKSTTMSVTALGTEFNISAYPENNQILATLIEGKVRVDCNERKKSYLLNPGQQVVYEKRTAQSSMLEANLADVTAWQKGMVIFRSDTMREILGMLERRYDITFQCNISNFNEDKYNFSFRQNSNLDEIMNVMKEIVGGFNYKIEGKVCYVKTIQR